MPHGSDPPGGRPEAFASDRAASLRAMFPSRQGTAFPPVAGVPAFEPQPPKSQPPSLSAEPPAAGRGRLGVMVVAGLVVAVTAGVVAASGAGRHKAAPGPSLSLLGSVAPVGGIATSRQAAAGTAAPSSVRASSPAPATSPATKPPPARGKPSSAPAAATTVSGPLTGYSACTLSGDAVFTVTFRVSFAWHHVFIDSDADTGTGYRVPQVRLGADFMVENGTLYRSTGSQWGWTPISGTSPLVAQSGGKYRWRVPLEVVDADGTVRSVLNGSGGSPDAYSPVLTADAC